MGAAISIDQEKSGTRARLIPTGRCVRTVVTIETVAPNRATIISPTARLPSLAESASAPPTPPSVTTLAAKIRTPMTQVHSESAALRGKEIAALPT